MASLCSLPIVLLGPSQTPWAAAMWSYALFSKNTYQIGERTRKSFTLSVWAGLIDVCWTPWVICFLQFLFLALSLSLSFFLLLCLHFIWFLPCVSSDTFLHKNSWRKTEASLFRCCDLQPKALEKLQNNVRATCHVVYERRDETRMEVPMIV